MSEERWTLSFLIGTPIWILALLACLVLAILALAHWRREEDGEALAAGIGMLAAFVVLLVIALSPLGYYPYKAEYHKWRPVTGQVDEVSKRLISSGDKGMAERYVFVIDGQPYGVDDTRASLVKVGDTVNLSCIRTWEYASVPGYKCRWNQ